MCESTYVIVNDFESCYSMSLITDYDNCVDLNNVV